MWDTATIKQNNEVEVKAEKVAHKYVRKLRNLRDGLQTAVEMLSMSNGDQDVIALLQELYVESDLAIDKPCGCRDNH